MTSHERHGVSNHHQAVLLALCEGNPRVAEELPSPKTSDAENASMSWRHHVLLLCSRSSIKVDLELIAPLNHIMSKMNPFSVTLPDMSVSNFNLSAILPQYSGKTVAMGTAITTRGIRSAKDMIKSLPYFNDILPSFCNTASPGYFYVWYMGFDYNDPLLSAPAGREAFSKDFNLVTTKECKGDFKVAVQFVKCSHSGKPAWAQNDALLAGYSDGMEYYYMTNDDTIMTTNNWTELFIEQLGKFNPPNVGLVGPRHSGGNTGILTYHFVHRTHIDIFKFFYPRNFTDWYGDDWATHIYEPNNVKKMTNIRVKHTLGKGTRYKYHPNHKGILKSTLDQTRKQLRAYLEDRGIDWEKWSFTPPPSPKPIKPTKGR